MTDTVTVLIENTYACGREHRTEVQLPAPGPHPTPDQIQGWWETVVHDHTGDGHPCGSREHAYCEALIVEAISRRDLLGLSTTWEG